MLINTDSKEFKDLCKLRRSQKAYEAIGDFVQSKKDFVVFNDLVALAAGGLIKTVDEVIKEQNNG